MKEIMERVKKLLTGIGLLMEGVRASEGATSETFGGRAPATPPATMQKIERKGVAGGASWK